MRNIHVVTYLRKSNSMAQSFGCRLLRGLCWRTDWEEGKITYFKPHPHPTRRSKRQKSTKTAQLHKEDIGLKTNVDIFRSTDNSQQLCKAGATLQSNGETTMLVDSLMQRTTDMMAFKGTNLVAFSGGVDSSLVASLLQICHGEKPYSDFRKVRAVLGVSPAVSPDQIESARRVAEHIGIDLVELTTGEQQDPTYLKNQGHSCWACKTHLYSALHAVSRHAKEQHATRQMSSTGASLSSCDMGDTVASTIVEPAKDLVLFNGTNLDDTHDATRVGLVAAREFQVQSPLDHITKDQVRQASKHLGLPNWNTAASPCLRSRLAFGVKATKSHLSMVHKAERRIKHFLRIILKDVAEYNEESTNLRFRLLAGNRAAVELDESLLHLTPTKCKRDNSLGGTCPTLHELLESSTELSSFFKEQLNMVDVVIRPFKSGSVAPKINANTISTL